MTLTFSETLHGGYAQRFALSGPILVDERSEFQHIRIFDTKDNGRVLVLDDIVQLTDRDEASYSEMLAHVPLLELTDPSKVMIVGGGDGAIAEEVLKHGGVTQVDLVDIDGRVVELSKEYFAHVSGAAFSDSRLNVRIDDAFEFLKTPAAEGAYDLIIADRPDPVGPAEVLFADRFYSLVSKALTKTGVAVFQTGAPFYQADELTQTIQQLQNTFTHAGTYLTVTPTYTGGFMALTWASNGIELGNLPIDAIQDRFNTGAIATDYYSPAIHQASFALPPWIERLVTTGN